MAEDVKTYPATTRRRQQLREAGDVACSPVLTSAVVLGAVVLMTTVCGGHGVRRLAALTRLALANAVPGASWEDVAAEAAWEALRVAGPVATVVLLACIVAQALQTGFLWAPKRVAARPPIIRMGHVLREALGTYGLGAAAAAALAGVGTCAVLYCALSGILAEPAAFAAAQPVDIALAVAGAVKTVLLGICGMLLVIGGLDVLYQWWRRERRIRMSRREVLQELRELEAHPAIRRRRSSEARRLRRHR